MKLLWQANGSKISLPIIACGIFIAGLVSGCAQTVESKPAVVQQVESGQSPGIGFLGSDASLLRPGKEGQAAMVYLNPNAQWSKYKGILLEPVQFWDSGSSSVSPADQQMLTTYYYNTLKENLEKKKVRMFDQSGPGVVTIQVALINATASTPGLRSVSVIIPQARILTGIASLATGSYAFVGSAETAMKATDSATGELLAAAIDKREGGMALSSAAQWQWGDAQNAMNFWAERVAQRITELKTGGTIK